ncbi:MAG: zf-HC2 domain-containing protein [Bryobacterales bacterium]|nr:anti-sigma factor [Bryobacteraceae bacterium]MDW8131788.1 zf-HC2 domain-containing protein [Bryobacterales bacterium]
MSGAHRHDSECKRIFALLSEYLDAELPADSCDQIEAHLKDCPPCLEFLESLRRTIELCRGFEPGELPGPLAESVRRELRERYEKALRARESQGAA